MVSSSLNVIVEARKDSLSVMTHLRRFAVHQFRRANHFPTKRLTNRLVAEANSQQRDLSRQPPDQIERYACIVRSSRSWLNHDSLRSQVLLDLIDRDLIVSTHFDRRSKLAKVLNEVVSKRIVVVDHE